MYASQPQYQQPPPVQYAQPPMQPIYQVSEK